MNNMKRYTFLFVFAVIAVLVSCQGDFLDVTPQNKYLNVNYYSTPTQAFQALIAAYDPLQYTYVDGHWTSSVMLGEIWSDNANAGGGNDGDQPGWQAIDDLKNDPSTFETQTFYKKYYIGVNKANQLLINNKVTGNDSVNQFLAEAKFLRAFHFFELVRTYGPIPLITTLRNPSDPIPPRNTLTEVYTQIEKDLLEAIPLLPKKSGYPARMAGRVTQGAAQALLGKAYLYWADLSNDDAVLFDKSAAQFQAVIESGEYELLDDYAQLYAFGAANTAESVFEIQFSSVIPADWGTPGAYINGNMIVQLCGIRGLCSNNPTLKEGWGFMLPTMSLYNSYLADDHYRRDASIYTAAGLAAGGCPIDLSGQSTTDYTGNFQKKYPNFSAYTAPNGGELNVLKDANQPVIRYADVLLMHAEALIRGTGSAATAATEVNLVRERAAGPGDNNATFKNAATLMSENNWTLLDVIYYERRAEFACEGDRWFDLVRSGRAGSALFPSGDLRKDNFSDQDFYLPIPQIESDLSGGVLTTYPDASLF